MKKTIMILGIILVILSSYTFATIYKDDVDLIGIWEFEESSGNFLDTKTNGKTALPLFNLDTFYQNDKIPLTSTYSTYGHKTTNGVFGLDPAMARVSTLNKNSFTLGCWVNNSLKQDYAAIMATMYNAPAWHGFEMTMLGSEGHYFQTRNDGAGEGTTQRTAQMAAGPAYTLAFWVGLSNTSGIYLLLNGTVKASAGASFGLGTIGGGENFTIAGSENSLGNYARKLTGGVDSCFLINRSLSEAEIIDIMNNWFSGAGGDTTPPTISGLNCTSCITDPSPDQAPYETEDTSPTFKFNTSENAWCVIGREDQSYTTMNATNNGSCSSGDETIGPHVCTLPVKDRFMNTGHNVVYISCIDTLGNENATSSSGQLIMNILGASETPGDDAIELGITTSEIGGTATIYNSQRISARNLATSQFTGIFDKVAVNGNKRWAFNYVSSGESNITNLFNLTPVLYVLQLINLTNATITDQVGKLINSTYP